ncbi:unnamed protein product, partial [Mesorhabditis spiculigera]
MSYEDLGRQVIAPHRGFNAKAREVLLDSPMKVEFDGIGQPPKVKHQRPHQKKFLGDIGKTRMDSDMESIGAYRSLTGDEAVSPQPGDQPKMQRNHYDVEERRNTVSKWLEKAGQ